MNENPFAALPGPAAGASPGRVAPVGHLDGLIEQTWECTQKHWFGLSLAAALWFAALMMLSYLITALENVVGGMFGFEPAWWARYLELREVPPLGSLAGSFALAVAFWLVKSFAIAVGTAWFTPFLLHVARGNAPSAEAVAASADRLPAVIVTTFVVQVLTGLASVFFLIPGWVLGFSWLLAGFVASDTQLGTVASLQYAWRLMLGHRLTYFLLSLLAGLAFVAGTLVTCGLGFCPGLSFSFLMVAFAYLRLSGRTQPGLADPAL